MDDMPISTKGESQWVEEYNVLLIDSAMFSGKEVFFMKKIFIVLVAVMVAMSAFSMVSYAGGHGRRDGLLVSHLIVERGIGVAGGNRERVGGFDRP